MISILLASYNGEKYIAEQIQSVLSQTVQDFKLLINDDRSTDSTFAIILEYAQRCPEKIFVSKNRKNTGGAKHNFLKMIIEHKDDYIMLCDQDDVWLPDKVQKSLDEIRAMEQKHGTNTPILVHSDLKVVDANLNVISLSYEKMANTSFAKRSLNNLLTMNIAAGCTAMYNRALAGLIASEPDYFVIHDWWLALTASAFGRIGTIHEPTILYRQHGNNDIGAKKVLSFGYIRYVLTHLDEMAVKVNNSYKQAGSFLKFYHDLLSVKQRELLQAYMLIPRLSGIGRLKTVFKHKTFMHSFSRKVAQILILLRERSVRQ